MSTSHLDTPWWAHRTDFAARAGIAAYQLAYEAPGWQSTYEGRCTIVHDEVCEWIDVSLEQYSELVPVLALKLEDALAHPETTHPLLVRPNLPVRLIEVDDLTVGQDAPTPGVVMALTLCVRALEELSSVEEPRRVDRPARRRRDDDPRTPLAHLLDHELEEREEAARLRSAGWVLLKRQPEAEPVDVGQLSLWPRTD